MKMLEAIYWITFAASLMVILAAVGYSWNNPSGHTGVDPMTFSFLSGPVFAFGVLGLLLTRGRWLAARVVVAIGLVGVAFGFYVTKLGVLNEYGDWIAAGMPDRNASASLWLVGFMVVGIGGSLLAAWLIRPKEE